MGKFKFGVGKLVAHSKQSPLVVPVYHRGMDEIVPEKVLTGKARLKKPSFPPTVVHKMGKKVEMYVGDALDFTQDQRGRTRCHLWPSGRDTELMESSKTNGFTRTRRSSATSDVPRHLTEPRERLKTRVGTRCSNIAPKRHYFPSRGIELGSPRKHHLCCTAIRIRIRIRCDPLLKTTSLN